MKEIFVKAKPYVIVLAAVLVITGLWLFICLRPISGDASSVRVVVLKGYTARDIGKSLDEQGLIRSPFVFVLACKAGGATEKLKPGVYELSRAMSMPQMIDHLVNGRTLESWVTIPEGFTTRQIADLLQSKQLTAGDAFLGLAFTAGSEFPEYSFIYGSSLEGYLFPDTYLIARGTDAQGIARKMLDAFGRKVIEPNRAEIEQTISDRFGLGKQSFAKGLNKLLILASMIEREAKVPGDRPLISAVLWNRLSKGMRLEVDATVTYMPGESTDNKDKIYYGDLHKDSPYNTYTHAGLPAGPICNPGLASIKAAMHPADVDYLYYVARPDGSHHFSRTFQEHIAAKNSIKNGGR
ncbi:endolytic transglycosylase MltG [bacterium]|nr:endolytic transglycosylase MltG [bacterium]